MAHKKRKRSLRPERWHEEVSEDVLYKMFATQNRVEELAGYGMDFDEAVKQADREFKKNKRCEQGPLPGMEKPPSREEALLRAIFGETK